MHKLGMASPRRTTSGPRPVHGSVTTARPGGGYWFRPRKTYRPLDPFPEPPAAAIGYGPAQPSKANRSPWSATRSSTSSKRSCSSPSGSSAPASTSSQVHRRGDVRLLAAAQGVRRDGGLRAGVLRPVEEHLAGPPRLGHRRGDLLRVLLLELLGDLLGQRGGPVGVELAGQGGVQVQALAAAGDRPGVEVALGELVADQQGDLRSTPSARRGSPGSRSMTSRFGLRGRPGLLTVHWCTCSSRRPG